MALPKFWSTAIAKVMVGEQPCLLSPWVFGHHPDTPKRPRDEAAMAVWKTKHTELLQLHTDRLKADGWRVDVERYFKVKGSTASVSGKADIVAQAKDRRPLIVDAKSGTPRDSDVAQVLIEMVMLPLAWRAPEMIFDGAVCYTDQMVRVTPAQAAEFKPRLMETMRRLGDLTRPDPHPGRDACRFCDYLDCAVRYVDEVAGETQEF